MERGRMFLFGTVDCGRRGSAEEKEGKEKNKLAEGGRSKKRGCATQHNGSGGVGEHTTDIFPDTAINKYRERRSERESLFLLLLPHTPTLFFLLRCCMSGPLDPHARLLKQADRER